MAVSKKKSVTPRKKNNAVKSKKKKSPAKKKSRLYVWFLAAGLLFLAAFVLSFVLNNGGVRQNIDVSGHKAQSVEQVAPSKKRVFDSSKSTQKNSREPRAKKIYPVESHPERAPEPAPSQPVADLAARTGEIDLAVLQTVLELGHDVKKLRNVAVEIRKYKETSYQYQELLLTVPVAPSDFAGALRSNLQFVEGAKVLPGSSPGEFLILWQTVPTHLIRLAPAPPSPPVSKKKTVRMVVILDDLGEDLNACSRLERLNFPVTMSVLPFTTHARDTADFARKKNLELMLHLPCEAIESPRKVATGPGGLLVSMSDSKILDTVRKDIVAVPGVVGVNNHMGSLFTQDERRMRVVLRELRRQNLFFLDSLTSPNSKVKAAAAKEGMTYIRRNVFLDNVQNQAAIMRQLRKAEALAWEKGQSIAIGHPYPATLATLEKWQHVRDKRILMTTVSQLLQRKKGTR